MPRAAVIALALLPLTACYFEADDHDDSNSVDVVLVSYWDETLEATVSYREWSEDFQAYVDRDRTLDLLPYEDATMTIGGGYASYVRIEVERISTGELVHAANYGQDDFDDADGRLVITLDP